MRHMVRIDGVASRTYNSVQEVLVCKLFDVQRLGRLCMLIRSIANGAHGSYLPRGFPYSQACARSLGVPIV